MSKMQLVQLDTTSIQLIDGDRGINYPNKKDLADKGYCLFLDSSNLTKNGFNFSSKVFIDWKKDQDMGKGHLQRGDIVINTRGTIGNIGYYSADIPYDNIRINSGMLIIRGGSDYDNRFLFDFLRSNLFFLQVQNLMSGSVQNQLPIWVIQYLKLPIIDNIIQQKIVSVLSPIDSKISLNNRINTELEALVKTLYDYWFVQFDFPDANGKPYKSSGGKMVWNEALKREIPEGWKVGELKDIANITMGQSPPGESYNEDGKGMIFFQGCTDFGNRFPSNRKFTTQPSRFAQEGDILLSVRAPVGTINIAKENCCIGRGLAALNSKNNCIAYLLGVMINLKQIFDRRNVDGTTFGSITKNDLFSLKVIVPDKDILNRYQEVINPAFENQDKIEIENQQLSSLRDWLLPMLMNGQVKVGEAKEQILNIAAETEQRYKMG